MLTVPPVPVMLALVPSGNVPKTLLIGSESRVALLLEESAAVTVATVPLPMAVAFGPEARHTRVPDMALQLRVFPAEVSAGPATAVNEATSVGE